MARRVPGLAALLAVAAIVVPVLFVATSLRASEDAEVERRLERAATDIAATLVVELDRLADLATDVAISSRLIDDLDARSYEALLDRYALEERFPVLNGISYIDRVPRDQLAGLLRLREPGGPALVLRDDAGEDLLRPVTMSYPMERNRAVVGMDLTSRPESRLAHDTASRTGRAVLSDLTQIVQLLPGEPGAVLHRPVDDGDEPSATVGLVFSVGQLFLDLDPLPSGVEIRLTDPDSAVFPDPVVLPTGEPLLDRSASAWASAHGQDWLIEVVATQGYVQPLLRRGSTLLGLGGIVAGLLVGLLIASLASRERHANELVATRTAEVRAVNADLAAANADLAAANARLELADRDKDDFLAAVSHELRTPLTVISGFVESLRRLRPVGDDLDAMLQPIDRNVRRLDGLVADLLTLVSLDAGALPRHPEPIRLVDMLATAAGELVGLPPHAVDVEVEGDPIVLADPAHLERILINLLSNADRHGAPPIEVCARGRAEGVVEVSVRDHGEGIPGEQAEVVFERFTRAAGKRAVTGTGLGLAIVRELASLGGGGIAYSSANPGARFTVWLPAADPGVAAGNGTQAGNGARPAS